MFIERTSPLQSQAAPSASVHTFTLPELLPPHARLLLDTHTSSALLVHLENADLAASPRSFQLTPASTRVFLLLLTSYPIHCSYHSLFVALYPLDQQQEASRIWQRDLALRPIRRAIVTLLPALRGLDLQVVSVRGQGYVLATQEADVQSQ
jgi:hypothetical protein